MSALFNQVKMITLNFISKWHIRKEKCQVCSISIVGFIVLKMVHNIIIHFYDFEFCIEKFEGLEIEIDSIF